MSLRKLLQSVTSTSILKYPNVPIKISCFNHKFNSFLITHQRPLSYDTSNSRENVFTAHHLANGSTVPPVQDGIIRLYNMKFCPFAQRALLVAEAKEIPYDVVNCNLKEKPDWLLQRNPGGKVPVLETKDGKVIYESLAVAEYLDEVYPTQRPLLPKDPYKRAVDRMFIGNFSSFIAIFYKLLPAIRYNEPDSKITRIVQGFSEVLSVFENELSRRGTTFFGGDQPAMLDYMIWPWIERLPAFKIKLADLFDYDAVMAANPRLVKWGQDMEKDPVIAKFILPPELHLEFIQSLLDKAPNYDIPIDKRILDQST